MKGPYYWQLGVKSLVKPGAPKVQEARRLRCNSLCSFGFAASPVYVNMWPRPPPPPYFIPRMIRVTQTVRQAQ